MAKLDRDGVKIHYEIHGSGPTILLSHGYSSTARMWDGQIAALKDRYQVIVWDFRGHGESDYPADQNLYSEALTVNDMAALLDVVGERRGLLGKEQQAPHDLVHAVAPRRFFSFKSCLQSTVSKTTSAAKTSSAPRRMNAST